MIQLRHTLLKLFFLIPIIISFSACLTTTVGGSGGGEQYTLKRSLTMPNYWETVVNKDVKPVYDAVLAGVKDLVFADSSDFKIRLSYEAPQKTLLLINTGLTGDRYRSVQLFQSIEKNL